MIDLREVATCLEPGEDGIWISRTESGVSYPAGGNEFCAEVEAGSFWFEHRNRCVLAALERFPPGGTLFDIGGGNGFVAWAVQEAGFEVVLIEPGPDGVAHARRRGIRNVVRSTLEDAGFQDGRLAAAGAFDVLEHIEDDHRFLASISRYLARQGRLYLTVPALTALWSQEDEDAGHYRRYAAGGLKRLLAGAGFEVEYLTYLFRWLPPAILLARALPYRLGVRRTHTESIARAREQHRAGGRVSKAVLKTVLRHELALVRAGRSLSLGSSCLAVARRL